VTREAPSASTAAPLRHGVGALGRGRMHYAAMGAGPPVVLLHGWPGYWFDFRHVLPLVAPFACAVAPDFFGFGESTPVPAAAASGEEALARDVIELLDALSFDRVVLVGQDIGSAVAPAVARLAPGRVRGLVLLNPTHPHIGDKRERPAELREAWYQQFHLLPLAEALIDGDRRRVELYLSHFYTHWAGEKRIDDGDLATIVDMYSRPGAFASTLLWYRARVAERRSTASRAAVHVPTIALWGDSDPMRPLDHRDGFELTFPASTVTVLRGVGHFVAAEAPDAVARAIADLVARG
jgi:pimeloyl-ACP methyl ester carboxylesterase